VVDVTKDEIIKTLQFRHETGNVRYDPVSRHVLVNLQGKHAISENRSCDRREIAQYPVGECRGNHGMVLDAEHRLAFLACEDNNLMTVFISSLTSRFPACRWRKAGDVIATIRAAAHLCGLLQRRCFRLRGTGSATFPQTW